MVSPPGSSAADQDVVVMVHSMLGQYRFCDGAEPAFGPVSHHGVPHFFTYRKTNADC